MQTKKSNNPMGRPRGRTSPETWKSGPDPEIHSYYPKFVQHRNQAKFRKEEYNLTFEEWMHVWGRNIINRGRSKGTMFMTRIDDTDSWNIYNVMLKHNGPI